MYNNEDDMNVFILADIHMFNDALNIYNQFTEIVRSVDVDDLYVDDDMYQYFQKQSFNYLVLFKNFIEHGDLFHNDVFGHSLIHSGNVDEIESFMISIIQSTRVIQNLMKIRAKVKAFPVKNWYRLYLLTKTEAFVRWYYAPENGGGKITKRKMESIISGL